MYSINNSPGRLRCQLFQRCAVTSSSKAGPETHLQKRTQCWFRLIKKKEKREREKKKKTILSSSYKLKVLSAHSLTVLKKQGWNLVSANVLFTFNLNSSFYIIFTSLDYFFSLLFFYFVKSIITFICAHQRCLKERRDRHRGQMEI